MLRVNHWIFNFSDANIEGVTTYSLHPGVIATELGRHMDNTFFRGANWVYKTFVSHLIKSPKQGAQTSIYCAVDEAAGKETGLYYAECKVKDSSNKSKNMENARELWEQSLKFVDLNDNYDPFNVNIAT